MLQWFNALFSFFGDYISMLFDLPFYGKATIGYVLLAVLITGVTLTVFVHRIK